MITEWKIFLHLKNRNGCWCQYTRHFGQKRLRQANNEMQWPAFVKKSPCGVEYVLSWNNLIEINSITTEQQMYIFLIYLYITTDVLFNFAFYCLYVCTLRFFSQFSASLDSLCPSFFIYEMKVLTTTSLTKCFEFPL